MKCDFRPFLLFPFIAAMLLCIAMPPVFAQSTGTTPAPEAATASSNAQAAANTQAAAAAVTMGLEPKMPDFIEEMADKLLTLFNIQHTGNSWQRYLLAASVIVLFYLIRRIVMPVIFRILRNVSGRVSHRFSELILAAVEMPVALFIMICGVYVAIRTLRYPPDFGTFADTAAKLLIAVVFLWLVLRVVGAFIDYLTEKAKARSSSISAFMPWIRKSITGIFFVIGALVIAQSFGFPVQTFLAGLGIGGLAFALAAQDTIANLFGAAVVAIDQPFKLGETVQLAGHIGTVEDIGLRSMKLRRPDKALVVIPNKTVASESIVNLSKFTNRRVDQVLGFTYDSTPDQLDTVVKEITNILRNEPEVDPATIQVFFRDFSASSLDVAVIYVTKEADYMKYIALRQRINLAFMRAAEAHKLSFAFPTQTIDLGTSAAKLLGNK